MKTTEGQIVLQKSNLCCDMSRWHFNGIRLIRLCLALLAWGLWLGGGIGTSSVAVAQDRSVETGAKAEAGSESTYSITLRRVPLEEALDLIVQRTTMDLVYSSRIVEGHTAYCARTDATAEELLRCVLRSTGMDYVRSSSGTFIIINAPEQTPRRGTLAGRVVDETTGTPLPFANVLLADASAGTSAGEDGAFSFASLLPGWHRVTVTYVGYRSVIDSIYVPADSSRRVNISLERQSAPLEPVVVDGVTQRLPSSGLGRGRVRVGERRLQMSSRDVIRGIRNMPGVAIASPLADLHIQGGSNSSHLTRLDGAPVRDPVSLGRHLTAFSPLALKRIDVHKAGFDAGTGSHVSGLVDVRHALGTSASPVARAQAGPSSVNAAVTLPVGPRSTQEDVPSEQALVRGGTRVMGAIRHSAWDVYRAPSVESLLERWNVADPLLTATWIGGADADVSGALPSLSVLRHRPDVLFSDMHVAGRAELRPFETFHVSGYRARNRIQSQLGLDLRSTGGNLKETAHPDSRLALSEDTYDWTNWASSVRYSRFVGARSILGLSVTAGHHVSFYNYRFQLRPKLDGESTEEVLSALQTTLSAADGTDERNQITEWTAKATLDHSVSPRHHFDGSVSVGQTTSSFELQNQFVGPFEHDVAAWKVAGHVAMDVTLWPGLSLEPGVRWTYLDTRRQTYVEPRLALRYDRSESWVGGYAVRLSGGLYRQFTQQYALSSGGSTAVVPSVRFWLPMDATLAPPKAYHAAAEALFLPHTRWTVQFETYYKSLAGLLTVDYPALPAPAEANAAPVSVSQDAFVASGRGASYGAGVGVTYNASGLKASLAYDWGRSRRTYPGRFEGTSVPAPWHDPHQLTLHATIPTGGSVSVSVSAMRIWGGAWGLRRAYYDYLPFREGANPDALDVSSPSADRHPARQRVDLQLQYRVTVRKARMRAAVGVLNALDRSNEFDRSVTGEDGFQTEPRRLPGRQPTFHLGVQF